MTRTHGTYRAQVQADDGTRWVDGGLFANKAHAEADALRLAAQYGNPTRVAADTTTFTEVRADQVRPGDGLWGAYLAGGSGTVVAASTTTNYPHVTTIKWTATRWINDQGQQCEAYEGICGQCFTPSATIRLEHVAPRKARGWKNCAALLGASQAEDVRITANGERVTGFLLMADDEVVRLELENGYGWCCDAQDVRFAEVLL